MNPLRKYLSLNIAFLKDTYRGIMLKTDKASYARLFNAQSFLLRSSARLRWDGQAFSVSDKRYPSLSYRIRHQRQCNMAYQYGFAARAASLGEVYHMDRIGFQNGDIFMDCGANVGDMKLWFDLRGIDVTYIGFEPSPTEFSCLVDNVKPSVAHNVGLWNETGELTFYVSSQGADSSLIEPESYEQIIKSKVMRLETYVSEKVKCLKLEAEGAEPEILEGLGDKIKLIEYITADVGFERGIKQESTIAPVTNYLLARGFELVCVDQHRLCVLYRNTQYS